MSWLKPPSLTEWVDDFDLVYRSLLCAWGEQKSAPAQHTDALRFRTNFDGSVYVIIQSCHEPDNPGRIVCGL